MSGLQALGSLSGKITPTQSLSGELSNNVTVIISGEDKPEYEGKYVVTPKAYQDQVLQTEGTILNKNIQILEIPYHETNNAFNGKTIYIGDEEPNEKIPSEEEINMTLYVPGVSIFTLNGKSYMQLPLTKNVPWSGNPYSDCYIRSVATTNSNKPLLIIPGYQGGYDGPEQRFAIEMEMNKEYTLDIVVSEIEQKLGAGGGSTLLNGGGLVWIPAYAGLIFDFEKI